MEFFLRTLNQILKLHLFSALKFLRIFIGKFFNQINTGRLSLTLKANFIPSNIYNIECFCLICQCQSYLLILIYYLSKFSIIRYIPFMLLWFDILFVPLKSTYLPQGLRGT